MPIISMFYGIVVRMFSMDADQHHLPHLLAEYSGKKAMFAIPTGEVQVGEFPSNKAGSSLD